MTHLPEVTPDTFTSALSATDQLTELMERMKVEAPATVTPADRVALTIVPEPDTATPAPVQPAPATRAPGPPKRSRPQVAERAADVTEKASRYPANIPASLHEALTRDCEVTGLSMTARTLAALNAQEAGLSAVFPAPIAATGGPIPVRTTVRRRKNLPEPSVTVTLYLDAEQAAAVQSMTVRLNAGSRSNLVTEALRRDLPD